MTNEPTDKKADVGAGDTKTGTPTKTLQDEALAGRETFVQAEKDKAKEPKDGEKKTDRPSGQFGQVIIEGVVGLLVGKAGDAAKADAKVAPKPEKPPLKDAAEADAIATQVYLATAFFLADADRVAELLKGRSEADIKLINEQFKKKHGISLEEHLKEELSPVQFKRIEALLHPKAPELAKPAETGKPVEAPVPEKPKASVEKDDKGHVTKVANEKGESLEFKYDKRGQITEMHAPDGTWKSKDGIHWKNEKGDQLSGVVDVKLDGTIRRPDATGERIEKISGAVTHTAKDGSKEVRKVDGSTLSIRDGHITRVAYENGTFRDFEYNAEGKLSKIVGDGGSWVSTDGKTWKNDKGEERVLDVSVDVNGNYHVKDGTGRDTISLTDGRTAIAEKTGSVKVVAPDGKLSETIDANGRNQKFHYRADGQINKFTTPDGVLWQSDDGKNWTNPGSEKVWKVSLAVEGDGTRKLTDDKGNVITLKLDGTSEIRETNGHIVVESAKGERRTVQFAIDKDALDKATDAIVKAFPKDYKVIKKAETITDAYHNHMQGYKNLAAQPNLNVYNTIMRDKSEPERKIIRDLYKQKTGEDLEAAIERSTENADKIRAKNLLEHGSTDRAGRVFATLVDHQAEGGLSAGKAEQDLRDTIATMNSKEIEELKKEYFNRYKAELEDAINLHEHISKETKDLLKVYLKGSDHRAEQDQEMLRLAAHAVDKRKMWMFQEIFRDENISETARKQFIADGGADKVKAAWGLNLRGMGDTTTLETPDMRHALDYMERGNLSVDSQVKDNTGTFDDNESAIKHAAVVMPDDERKQYFRGKELEQQGMTWIKASIDQNLSKEDKAAFHFYQRTHDSLTDPGNSTEVADWEATIRYKDQQIVGKIADRRHWYGDDKARSVMSDIENMSEVDWKRAKDDPIFREQIVHVADTIVSDADTARIRAVLEKKLAAETFEKSNDIHRDVVNALKELRFISGTAVGGNPDAVLKALRKMSDEEKQRYHTDPEFRKQISEELRYFFYRDTQAHLAVKSYLQDLERGEKTPPSELQLKLESYPSFISGTNMLQHDWQIGAPTPGYMLDYERAKIVRDVQQSLDSDPKLRERIANPQTAEDKEFSERIQNVIRKKLKGEDVEAYIKPLLESGTLPVEKQIKIDDQYEGKHKKDVYRNLLRNTDELERLRNDDDFRATVLKPLSNDERLVAEFVIAQGKMEPEDIARAAVIGKGVDNSALRELIGPMTQDEKEELKINYAKKYKEDFVWRGLDETSGRDERDFKQDIRRDPTSKYELYDETRMEAYRSRDGFGSNWVDSYWDGTGFQVDAALNTWTANLTEASKHYKELYDDLPLEKQKELQNNLYSALDNFRESKESMANVVTDGVIAVAAIAGAAFTGGASLGLLTVVAVAGGTFKVAAKSAIMDSDYDDSKVLTDFLTGAVDAAASFVGPGEFAAMLGIGKKAATTAAFKAVEEVGIHVVQKGGQEALEQGMTRVVRDAIVRGAPGIEEKAIKELAEKVVTKELTGAAREKAVEQLAKSIEKNLAKEVEMEARSWLTRKVTEYGFVTGGGAFGGAASGMTRGFTEWDMSKSFGENMSMVFESTLMSGMSGGVGAGAFHTVFKVAGSGYRLVRGKGGHVPSPADAAELGRSPDLVGKEGDYVLVRPKDAPPLDGDGVKVSSEDLKTKYKQVGTGDYYFKDGDFFKLNEKGNLVRDEHVMAAISDEAVLQSPEFQFVRMSETSKKAILERVKNQDLAQPKAMDAFLDKATSAMSGKEDLSNLVNKADVAHKTYNRKWYAYTEEVVKPLEGKVPDADLNNPAEVRKHVGNDPEKIQYIDDYLRARKEHGEAQAAMKAAADQRAMDVQNALNEFADSKGLPRVKVEWSNKLGAASGTYADGKITMNAADLLSGKRPADMMATSYHEFVHNEQDGLIIRNLADEARVGKTVTPDQVKGLQDAYKERAGGNLSEDHLKEVLRARDGRALSKDDLLRAQELTKSWRDNSPLGEQFKQAKESWQVTQRELGVLNASKKDGAKNLIARLAADDSGTLQSHLFGTEVPENVKALIVKHKQIAGGAKMAWPEKEATEVLEAGLQKRSTELQNIQREGYSKYIGTVHEQDALVIDKEIRTRAQQRGYGDAGPSQMGSTRVFESGERAKVDGIEFRVVDQQGDLVAVRRAQPAGPIEGNGLKVSERELSTNYEKVEAGKTTYYRSRDGAYYRQNKNGELVEDFDVEFVKSDKLSGVLETDPKQLYRNDEVVPGQKVSDQSTAASVPMPEAGRVRQGPVTSRIDVVEPQTAQTTVRAAGEEATGVHARPTSLQPEGYVQGDRISLQGEKYEIAGFDPQNGDAILRKPGASDDSMLGHTVSADEFAKDYKPVKLGDETLYKDGNGKLFRHYDMQGGREMLVPDPELKLVARDNLDAAQLLEIGTIKRGWIKTQAELNLAEARKSAGIPVQDPKNTEIMIDNHKVELTNGQVKIGRDHRLPDGTQQIGDVLRVSRDHGTLSWVERSKSFYYEDHSSHGTWIKRAGSDKFERVNNKLVKIGQHDEVRLGSPDGPQLRLAGIPENNAQPAFKRETSQVFFDGKEVKLKPGEPMTVGRAHQDFGNQSQDVINTVVSRDHGTLGLNKDGQLVYTDHSFNGTFIKRAGTDKFEIVKGKATVINAGDQVRLGSEFGPELKLTSAHGQTLQDGSVIFERPGELVHHRPDGYVQVTDRGGIYRVEDGSGKVLVARDSTGADRYYSYDQKGELTKIQYANGRVMQRAEGSDSWTITQTGAAETTYKGRIDVEPDGSLKYNDGNSPAWREKLDGTMELTRANGRIDYAGSRLDVEKPRLEMLAEAHFAQPAQKQRFLDQMKAFEDRAKKAGVSDQEIASTYHQVNRLMTAGAEAPIPHSQRVRLAEQIMEQASSPTAIDQGYNSTCNVATVEGRIFSRQPSEAARLITDVATTGKYISADGKIVDLGRVPGALDPDGESLASLNRPFDPLYREDIKVNGRRTYASQILETTAVNLKWANASTATPGDVILYEKHFSAVPNDTGERLVKYRANPDGTITRQELGKAPDIRDYELMEIHNQITGGTDKNFVIRGPGYTKAPPETVLQVHSEADLADVLEKMANEKQFPAIIMVDVHHPPFNRFMGDPNAGGNGGLHVVNIQGFYKTAEGKMMVEFSNQWGVESHHMGTNAVPVETLFEATKPPRRQP